MRDLWLGNANAWECDELGHLNVKFYAAKALEAFAALVDELGIANPERLDAGATARVREIHSRFLAEARPGAALAVAGGVLDHDETSLTALLEMRHEMSGEPAAAFRVVADHVHVKTGRVFPWPSRFASPAEAWRVALPEHAAPRGLVLAPLNGTASMAEADRMDMPTISSGVYRIDEADPAGIVRPSAYIGRSSDSSHRMIFPAGVARPPNLSMAALENRLAIRRPARPGDRFVQRAGYVEIKPRAARFVNWVLDPVSGLPWATFEGFGVFFDLEARRAAAPPPEVAEALKAWLRPGLTV
jgi:acyl-CoA thioester hydrolase